MPWPWHGCTRRLKRLFGEELKTATQTKPVVACQKVKEKFGECKMSKLTSNLRLLSHVGVTLLLQLGSAEWRVQAQIVPDATLPNNSRVTVNDRTFTIEGGSVRGGNHFHSFKDFSLPTGTEAIFNNTSTIDNIITRVTGGAISDIDGLIRANGGANLFLINPNGIIFGPNARLEIGGSFFASTATRVLFQDGIAFTATNADSLPLLTINVPVGLQLGPNARRISVRGNGHGFTSNTANVSAISTDSAAVGLQVSPEKTLALVGGSVEVRGGMLRSPSGRIEIGAVANGTVLFDTAGLNYSGVTDFGNMELAKEAGLDASGAPGGDINIVGENLSFRDGSVVLIQNRGENASGNLRLQAGEQVSVVGENSTATLPTMLSNESVSEGNSGKIEIVAQRLQVLNGGTVRSSPFNGGTGSEIMIRVAKSVEIAGFSPTNPRIFSLVTGLTTTSGNGSNITLSTNQLKLTDGGILSAVSRGSTGGSGDLTVNANEIFVAGFEPRTGRPSSISSGGSGSGNSGNLQVNTDRLIMRNGGFLGSTVLDAGNSGSLTINATEFIDMSGRGKARRTSIGASAINSAPAQIAEGFPPVASGNSGSVTINTSRLTISNGAQLSVGNEGNGAAGNMIVNASQINLFNTEGGGITAQTASGEGGNIRINTQNLQLRDRAQLSAEAGGTGNGGNLTINGDTIVVLESSLITAKAMIGNGGNINITTQGLFLSPDSSITASSQFGIDGIVQINNPEVDSTQGLVELSQQPIEASDRIVSGCAVAGEHSFIVTGRGGLPPNPEQFLTGDLPWIDLRDLSAFRSPVAQFSSSSDPDRNSRQTIVEANAWIIHPDGTVELVALAKNSQPEQLPTNCAAQPTDS